MKGTARDGNIHGWKVWAPLFAHRESPNVPLLPLRCTEKFSVADFAFRQDHHGERRNLGRQSHDPNIIIRSFRHPFHAFVVGV
jgi:hypothetical protein